MPVDLADCNCHAFPDVGVLLRAPGRDNPLSDPNLIRTSFSQAGEGPPTKLSIHTSPRFCSRACPVNSPRAADSTLSVSSEAIISMLSLWAHGGGRFQERFLIPQDQYASFSKWGAQGVLIRVGTIRIVLRIPPIGDLAERERSSGGMQVEANIWGSHVEEHI